MQFFYIFINQRFLKKKKSHVIKKLSRTTVSNIDNISIRMISERSRDTEDRSNDV